MSVAMRVDIRLPLGLMFVVLGFLLAIYGIFSDPEIYERSLGVNINLAWGTIMLLFGAILLILNFRKKKGNNDET